MHLNKKKGGCVIIKAEISVRDLVEFIMRSGNIDSGYISAKRALEGTAAHQKLQKLRKREAHLLGHQYESEVSLKYPFNYEDAELTVHGRADGIIRDTENITIEEIKSTYKPLEDFECDYDGWHFGQAKCYGYIYALQNGCESIDICVTYCNIETGEHKEFNENFAIEQLEEFFLGLIAQYYVWIKSDYERKQKSKTTIKDMPFPFETYRKGQREFAVAVYKTIKAGKKMFTEMPTGTGKTMSTLFPSIKAIGEGLCGKIFYATAKNITRQVAEKSLSLMAAKGLAINSITLTAKDKICFSPGSSCSPRECAYAQGHFDRVNNAVYDILENTNIVRRETIEKYALKHTVCPFEFQLDVAVWAAVVICDYNHVFDPNAKLKRFFSTGEKTDAVLLVDESHNLVERARDMFSASLARVNFSAVRKIIKKKSPLHKVIGKIDKYFTHLNETYLLFSKTCIRETADDGLFMLLQEFQENCDQWLAENQDNAEHSQVMELYFSTLDFLRTADFFDQRYRVYMERNYIKLLCLDPSYLLAQAEAQLTACIFFSATFTPLDYFSEVLGGDSSDYMFKLPSPFKKENLLVLVNDCISTKYKQREQSYDKISDNIYQMVSAQKGNYFAFFSSYEYMTAVADVFSQRYAEIRTVYQTPQMSETDRENFLNLFDKDNEETLLGFVVMGGVFSEGIDLVGDMLIGTAIIGVGLPMLTEERNAIAAYYDGINMDGYKFAYMYPGMNKVLQAAGRVIRTESDRGIVVLIDTRFLSPDYLELFPYHWSHFLLSGRKNFDPDVINDFWRQAKGGGLYVH